MNFTVGTEGGLSLTFHSRTVAEDGWVNSYFVTASAPDFSASVAVDNAPYGSSPAELFAEIASQWCGWLGVKTWQALEGEYQLSASSDLTGHITIAAQFGFASVPPNWEAEVSVVVEAGRLERLAAEAKEFFGPVHAKAGA